MATLDEIFASMPEEAAEGVHDLLIIDPEARTIDVPETESIFGVENDGRAETKYFQAPRYVGHGIDLAACFLRVNYQNANGDRDAYLVNDLAISGEHVLFSWELSKKVTQYKGSVQFVICANLPGSTKVADWHTTLAQGKVLEGLEPDAAAVEAASSDVIAQLLELVTRQTEAVEAAGAAQVANVQTEGTAQVDTVKAAAAQAEADALAEIEAKKQNALAQLPADYTAMGSQVDKLTRTTAGAIVCEAEGQTIQVHDASDNYLAGLRIFGRSTQDGTPTPEAPVEIVSTPAPVVTVCGKNLVNTDSVQLSGNNIDIPIFEGMVKLPLTFSWAQDFARSNNNALFSLEVDGVTRYFVAHETAGECKKVITAGEVLTKITVLNWSSCIGNLSNMQLELGDVSTKYESCTGQTITLANELPGIPVSSGGNYTDANGQQWVCDEVDLARGVYVQRILEVAYDGAGETWYKSKDDNENYLYHISVKQDKAIGMGDCFCNRLRRKGTAEIQMAGKTLDMVGISPSPKYNVIYLNVGYYLSENTIEALTAYLAANPLTVQYVLATPVERALSEEELAAWRNLRSNKPTTTILNDAGAHMAVEYVADTKLYIDRKLEEILAAKDT